jgi:hypothetical protein
MTGRGYLRRKRAKTLLRIDSISYAFNFDFGMALRRLVSAN